MKNSFAEHKIYDDYLRIFRIFAGLPPTTA